MLDIDFSSQSIKFLKKISGKPARQIKKKLEELRINPHPQDSVKLIGYPFHRVDQGEYRIIYRLNNLADTVEIKVVAKRNDDEAYKILARHHAK